MTNRCYLPPNMLQLCEKRMGKLNLLPFSLFSRGTMRVNPFSIFVHHGSNAIFWSPISPVQVRLVAAEPVKAGEELFTHYARKPRDPEPRSWDSAMNWRFLQLGIPPNHPSLTILVLKPCHSDLGIPTSKKLHK